MRFFRNGGVLIPRESLFSLFSLLQDVYPEHTWDVQKFPTWPRHRAPWLYPQNVRAGVLFLGEQLGIEEGDYHKWNNVSLSEFERVGGSAIAKQFKRKKLSVLEAAFPEHKWNITDFARKPRSVSLSPENIRSALKSIGGKMGLQEGDLEAWYKVTNQEFITNGGGYLLKEGRTRLSILKTAFPDHKWDPKFFERRPKEYFESREQLRALMETLGTQLGVKVGDYDGWYSVSWSQFRKIGGMPLIRRYGSDKVPLLRAVFPEHKWDPERFIRKMSRHWDDPEYRRASLVAIGAKLGMREGEHEEWYRLPPSALRRALPKALARLPLHLLLASAFPEHKWTPFDDETVES